MRGMVASPHEQQIPPLRFAPVGMTTKKLLRSGRKDDMRLREVGGARAQSPQGWHGSVYAGADAGGPA